MPDIWGQVAILAKLALYMGVLTAGGLVMARLIFADHVAHISSRITVLIAVMTAMGIVASVASFALRGAALTGDASGVTDMQILGILWQTPVGTVLKLRIIGLALILVGLLFGRPGRWISLFGTAVAIWSFAEIGHMSEGALWLKVILVVHLAGVAFWIGVLPPPQRLVSDPTQFSNAADLGHRFGIIASVVVPALILAGGYSAWLLVGSISNLTGTSYGLTLLIKIGFVGLLLGLAAANKLRFVPGLKAGDPTAARHLSRSISVEWVAVIAILSATSILTSVLTVPT
ncbi:MAG: CopD family protein [Roseicyclus sp.]|nr:CopD family protein [Roseicyclus sp.]